MDELRADLLRELAGPEEQVYRHERNGWSTDDQVDDVLEHLHIHQLGESVQVATDREMYILEELVAAGVLAENARGYFKRMSPEQQPEREAWLFARREQHKQMREALEEWRRWRELHGYPMPDHIRRRLVEAGF